MYKCIFQKGACAAIFALVSLQMGAQVTTEYVLTEAVKVERRKDALLQSSVPSFGLDTLQLRRTAATDLSAALRHVAGINVRDYGGAGGLKTISVRGIGAAHTTVCYDGLPMASTQSGAVDIGKFAYEQIRSIRLDIGDVAPLLAPVKTLSAATLFVNTQNSKVKDSFTANFQTGHWELVNPSIAFSKKLNRSLSFGGNACYYFRNNNYSFHIDNGSLSEKVRRNNSSIRNAVGELWMNNRLGAAHELRSKFYYAYNNNELPGAVVLYNNVNHEAVKDALWFLQSAYDGRWKRTHLSAAVKMQGQSTVYTDDDPQYPPHALRQRYRQHEFYATAGAEHRLSEAWTVAYAADYFYNHLSTHIATADGVSRNTLMQALSLRYKQKRWTATARMVAHQVWNKVPRQHSEALQQAAQGMHKWQPSVSAVYRMDEYGLAFRAFYKDYFRQPTFSENYFYHLGTAQLKPERTRQVGGGITWQENAGNIALKATVDAYYNDISDRITSVPYNLFVWRTENRGKVTITGLDATLHANYRMNAQHQFIVAANYSLQKAEDITSPADNNYGKQPAYLPQHSGAVSITWENPWVNLNVGLTAASERWSTHNHAPQTRLPGYAEINASLLRNFPCGKGVLTTGLFLNNALDKSYEVIRRYPMPLRNVMFKVGWGF